MLRHAVLWGLVASVVCWTVTGCGPSNGPRRWRRLQPRRNPLVPQESDPKTSEFSTYASGPAEGRIVRGEPRYYKELIMFTGYNPRDGILDLVDFRHDTDGTGRGRLLSPRCVEKLKALAISVMNQWPGQKLRVVDGWIENVRPGYPNDSLHYEGRAVDITTSDRDRSRIGMLARLAVEAGFDWVYYETKNHIHCSVKSESSQGARTGGCFTSSGTVRTEGGRTKKLSDLRVGERVLSYDSDTGRLVFSEVLMFLDRDTDAEKPFLRLTLSGGSVLTVTPQHLVMRRRPNGTDVEAVFAARLEPSDELLVSERNGTRLMNRTLLSSQLVLEKGVIAPLTSAGTVVVDDVVASCYAVIESQTIAHLAFAPVRAYNSVVDVVVATSRFLTSPFSWERPVTERHVNGTAPVTSEGVHWYPSTLYYLSNHLIPSYLLYKS